MNKSSIKIGAVTAAVLLMNTGLMAGGDVVPEWEYDTKL